ncbi:polysaccharide deacetylase family protein [Streptomyces brevispora]|uniref:polysaccharide deacetylase family protein n=1 Tax=Streptomyces brevispora TaxID=887462 RepID=UPI002E30D2AD|nr:polysaccharide deacetylase family protein [Streptomyces brevispora]
MTTATVLGAVLGGGLVGCRNAEVPRSARPAAADSASAAAHAPVRTPSSAPPATKRPPTLAPGPDGLTSVFKRGPQHAEKVVAFTFDADMTADEGSRAAAGEHFDNPELIALLRRLKVPATVFMTGRWAEEYPSQARSIGTDPLFEIGNHSYSHYAFTSPCYGLPTMGTDEIRGEVERTFGAIRKTGARNVVPYFRFPGGCYDNASLRALAPEKVTAVQWDVVSGDAFATDAEAVAEQVLDGVKPGSLVVMHCTRSAAPVTDQAVGRVVPELRKRGYRFVKVSELMAG